MYIPNHFLSTDTNETIAFMKQFSFATIITSKDNLPKATHLPFVISVRADKIILTAHFAKANEQWKEITDNKILVIFSEPHAYISPKHYEKEMSVPTWNYISVHAYGSGKLIMETEQVFDILEKIISTYEADYKKQWDTLPLDFKLKMMSGIVAFEIVVSDLQTQKKLSQNKKESERQKIIETLSNSESESERQIAGFMKKTF